MDALIGKTLSYSLSKIIHEQLTNKPYALIETDNLERTLASSRFHAINITNPYKRQAAAYCQNLDPSAKQTGVVNTMIKHKTGFVGYNTDVYAIKALFRSRFPLSMPVSIIGNGATAASIKAAFMALGHRHVRCYARKPRGEDYPLNALYDGENTGILIHATPVGTAPHLDEKPVIDLEKLSRVSYVFDVVYNPYRTALLRDAKMVGIPHMNGLMMLVLQAVAAHKIATNNHIDEAMVKSLYDNVLRRFINRVLVGMPGVGKSALALALAKQLNQAVFDSDVTIQAISGLSVPSFINRYGEEKFRKQEYKAISKISVHQGVVIASGGGVIESSLNMNLLKAQGLIIYIKADGLPSDTLLNESRPLLKNASAWESLHQKRQSYYERYADIVIDYTNDPQSLLNLCEVKVDEYLNSQRPEFKLIGHS